MFGQCFSAAGLPAGTEFQVNSTTEVQQRAPSIATDRNGRFTVAWNNGAQYGGVPNVSARVFTLGDVVVDPDPVGLQVDKTDNDHTWGSDPAIPYAITVSSEQLATDGVVLTDTVPANTTFEAGSSTPGWTCESGGIAGDTCTYDIGDLAADESTMVTFAVTVDAELDDQRDIYNRAVATGFDTSSRSSRSARGLGGPEQRVGTVEVTRPSTGLRTADSALRGRLSTLRHQSVLQSHSCFGGGGVLRRRSSACDDQTDLRRR